MAEVSLTTEDPLCCPVCLELLKDPVTIPCGHSYCMNCIRYYWDQDDQRRVYSCPQCRQNFTPRPVLNKNTTLAELVEKKRKIRLQAAHHAVCYAGPGDVECDICTGRKLKAVKSCLVCLVSFCETHLQPHYESPAYEKHKLVEASSRLQDRICSQHDKLMEIYCHTDQKMICYLCTMDEHKGHDTVSAAAERTEKQKQLREAQIKSQERVQEREKELQELKQTVTSLRISAQTAVEDSERIFTEMIDFIVRKCSEVTEQIRAKEKTEVSLAEDHMKKVEQEIAELRKRETELEQLSHTEDHIHFLQSFQSLSVQFNYKYLSSMTVNPVFSFEDVKKSVSEMKKSLEEFLTEERLKIPKEGLQEVLEPISTLPWRKIGRRHGQVASLSQISTDTAIFLSAEPKTREEFLQYFCQLTLDLNTAHRNLCLSDWSRKAIWTHTAQSYPDHPDRFDECWQILCRESLSRCCYWEVEWTGMVSIAVSYKGISRKGEGNECKFGHNDQSWSLDCSRSSYTFRHINNDTEIPINPSCSRVGVYLDHRAGTLSFYSVSDTMTLLHRVQTTFTQPLYAGFWSGIWSFGSIQILDL